MMSDRSFNRCTRRTPRPPTRSKGLIADTDPDSYDAYHLAEYDVFAELHDLHHAMFHAFAEHDGADLRDAAAFNLHIANTYTPS